MICWNVHDQSDIARMGKAGEDVSTDDWVVWEGKGEK